MNTQHPLRWILLAAITGFGFNPMLCENGALEDAREKLKQLDGEGAKQVLQQEELDAPEIHLARALAHYQLKEFKEATTSLDQVDRLIADAQSGGDKMEPKRLETLVIRLAEGRGWVALGEERWEDAQVEWLKVLKAKPDDEDARWNYELAWHKSNPACALREDDHEPDDTLKDAPEWTKEKAEKRLLCPGASDAYAIELPQGAIFTAKVEAKLLDDQDEEAGRQLKLKLYRPSTSGLDQAVKEVSLDLAPSEAEGNLPASGSLKVNVEQVAEAGRWVMWLEGYGRGEVEYSIVPEIDIPCPQGEDDLEPNDDVQSAKPLQGEEKANLKICPNNDDWHIVGVPEGEYRTLEVEFDTKRDPFSVIVFDTKGQVIKALNSTEHEKGVMSVRLPESGVAEKFEMPKPPESANANPVDPQSGIVPNTPVNPPMAPQIIPPTKPQATPPAIAPSQPSPLMPGVVPSQGAPNQIAPSPAQPNPTQPNSTSPSDPSSASAQPSGSGDEATEEEKKGPPTPYIVRVTATVNPNQPIALGNRYKLKMSPPQESGDDENKDKQDQQDQQNQDQQDQQNQDQQDKQEQQDQQQQDQQEQQQDQPQPEQQNQEQVDLQQLIDSLDEHEHNPQLEKALKLAPALPQMEDY